MRSFMLLAVLAGAAMAAPKPAVDCITKGNTVIEVYDVTVTEVVYVTEGAAKPTPTYVPAHTTKRRKHKHKPKPTTTAAAVYQPVSPAENNYVVTITVGAGGYEQPPSQPVYEPPPVVENPPPVVESPAPVVEPPKNPAPSGQKPSTGSSSADYVAIHNWYRERFGCNGVSWSDELAAYAQNYAASGNGCQANLIHSQGPYGENLARGTSLDGVGGVNMWMSEFSAYDYNNPDFSGATGHMTQVVWKDTTHIGCATYKCPNMEQDFVICEYQPAGNMLGAFAQNVPGLVAGASLD